MQRILLFLLFLSLNVYAEDRQFVCELKSEVKIADFEKSTPNPKVNVIKERYLFLQLGNAGYYLNRDQDFWLEPVTLFSDSQKLTFVEYSARSDNLFVATIFLDKGTDNTDYPIIMSNHAWAPGIGDFYNPSQRYGICRFSKVVHMQDLRLPLQKSGDYNQ